MRSSVSVKVDWKGRKKKVKEKQIRDLISFTTKVYFITLDCFQRCESLLEEKMKLAIIHIERGNEYMGEMNTTCVPNENSSLWTSVFCAKNHKFVFQLSGTWRSQHDSPVVVVCVNQYITTVTFIENSYPARTQINLHQFFRFHTYSILKVNNWMTSLSIHMK